MRLVAALVLLVLYVVPANAEPVYEAKADNARILLHTEECRLKTEVINLPMRATWTEGGQVTEGCWGPRPDMGVVVAYFSDKTAVAIPIRVFTKVIGV